MTMATMKVVLALACAAVLGAPAAAADNLRGVEVTQEASHTRTLQAVTDLCGEAGEKPCADGCANGFKLHEDGLCVMNLGRSMLQSFVGISGSSTASIGGGKKANRRGKGKGKKNNRRGKGKKNNRRGKNNKRNNRRGKKNNRRGKGKNGNTRRPTASGSAEFTATASGNGPASAGGTTFVSVNSGRSSVTTSTSVFGFAGATPGGAPPPPLTGPPGMYGGGPPPLNGPPGMYGGKTAAPPTITPITPAPVAKPACAGQCATNWGRCAGQGIQGVRACCDSDYECVERTSGFAQCRPKASSQFALKWKLSSAGNVLQCTSTHN